MDPELKEYLDKQREYLDKQFKSIGERFVGIDKRFDGVDERFEGLEATVRQTNVVVEDLRGKIQLVAEGVATVDAKLERFREEVSKEIQEVRTESRLLYAQHNPRAKTAKKKLKSA